MKQPKVIFFDAVNTLFGIRGTVGDVYSAIAAQFGVEVASQLLDKAFFLSFKNAPPLAFPNVDPLQVLDLEFQWWYEIAYQTFSQVGVIEKFTDFDAFFAQLYNCFAQVTPWFVYSDVFSTLEYWQKQGIELGIISNFDSRIYEVLDLLGLSDFFSSITISSSTGAAKPNPQIFAVALDKHDCLPHQAWHIGDSFKEDYEGAKSAGINAFLLERNRVEREFNNTIFSLEELL